MSYIRRFFIALIIVFICCGVIKGTLVYAEEISGELEVIMILSEEEMRPYLDAFEEKYPGVTVKYMVYENYEEEMKKRMEAGDYGDVFFLPGFLTEADFATYLAPIGTMTALSQKYNYMEQSCQLNGMVYGVPSCVYLSGILYNKEVFHKAGNYADNIGFMPFPNSIAGKQYMTVYTDYNYGISVNTDNKAAAKAFITFMLEESGFALEHENLSIVKTDPYPDTYELNENVIILSNAVAAGQNYQLLTTLQTELNLPKQREIQRVIDSARGNSSETFDDIMDDWNQRWEASRPVGIVADINANEMVTGNVVFDNSKVQFSDTEKKYLLNNPSLKVGFLQNMAPLSYEYEGDFCIVIMKVLNNY